MATVEQEDERIGQSSGPLDLPDEHDDPYEEGNESAHSLTDDFLALLDDGRTYAEAEIAYQKSRGVYVGGRAKQAVALGLGAFGVLHLALIAATVGAVFALIPLVGPWIATGIVTVVLVIAGAILLRLLKRRIDDIRAAFSDEKR